MLELDDGQGAGGEIIFDAANAKDTNTKRLTVRFNESLSLTGCRHDSGPLYPVCSGYAAPGNQGMVIT